MHFELTVTLGDVLKVLAITGFGLKGLLYLRRIDLVLAQHQMLWEDLLERRPELKPYFRRRMNGK